MIQLDEFDRKILRLLQDNARISNAEIARQIHLAPSATLERVRRLEKQGTIKGYHAILDASQLGWGISVFVFVQESSGSFCPSIYDKLLQIEEIQEVHSVAGEDGLLIKVHTSDIHHFHSVLQDKILALDDIVSTRSVIVLKTIKESLSLPIPGE